jgi:hypothetical protein
MDKYFWNIKMRMTWLTPLLALFFTNTAFADVVKSMTVPKPI